MILKHVRAARLGFACVALVGAADVPALAQNCVQFSGRAFAVGDVPDALVTGDLNGDAIPDLVTANYISADISILLGEGDGTFAKAKSVPLPGGAQRMAIGDLDGDDKLDLAVSLLGSESLMLLFGDGHGSFQSSKSLSMKLEPRWIFLEDLNGDEQTDVVVGDTKHVTVRLSKGGGSFKPATDVLVTTLLYGCDVGDLNEDSKPDLVLTRSGSTLKSVIACFGDGLGGFSAPVELTSAFAGSEVAIGEVTGDAIADVVIGQNEFGAVKVLPGLGGGVFAAPQSFAGGVGGIAIADFDGNGRGDVAGADGGGGEVAIFAGETGIPFPNVLARVPAGFQPADPGIGDLDSDGFLDVVVRNPLSGSITALLGIGNAGLVGPTQIAFGTEPRSTIAGDFNGDSKADLAVFAEKLKLRIYIGDGAGGFELKQIPFPSQASPGSAASADLNGDGKLDLVVADASYSKIWTLLGNGLGGFAAAKTFASGSDVNGLRVGDFNNDDAEDVAVISWSNKSVAILLGDGLGGLGAPTTFATEAKVNSLALGDLNRDGNLDVVTTSNKSTRVSVKFGDGKGGLGATQFSDLGSVPRSAVIVDLDGDTKLDIVTAHRFEDEVSILWGKGNGKFAEQTRFAAGPDPASLYVADFDADGLLDLFVLHAGHDAISVLRGKGSGQFAKPMRFAAGRSNGEFAIADFDSNALLDFCVVIPGWPYFGIPSGVSIHLNTCAIEPPESAPQSLVYGARKPGSFGVPMLTSSKPKIGSTVTVTLGYSRPVPGVLLLGLAPLAVPFDGGTLLVEPLALAPFAVGPSGTASLEIPIPSNAALLGTKIYLQAILFDSLARGAFNSAQTHGLRWVIGS